MAAKLWHGGRAADWFFDHEDLRGLHRRL